LTLAADRALALVLTKGCALILILVLRSPLDDWGKGFFGDVMICVGLIARSPRRREGAGGGGRGGSTCARPVSAETAVHIFFYFFEHRKNAPPLPPVDPSSSLFSRGERGNVEEACVAVNRLNQLRPELTPLYLQERWNRRPRMSWSPGPPRPCRLPQSPCRRPLRLLP